MFFDFRENKKDRLSFSRLHTLLFPDVWWCSELTHCSIISFSASSLLLADVDTADDESISKVVLSIPEKR